MLHLEGSPALALAPSDAGVSSPRQLAALTLDASAALGSLPALRGAFPALAALRLSNVKSCGVPWQHSTVGRVAAALGGCGGVAVEAGPGPSQLEAARVAARIAGAAVGGAADGAA